MSAPDPDPIEKEMNDMKSVVTEALTPYFTSSCSSSNHNNFEAIIGRALRDDGDKLKIECITGGVTNFSYKVYPSKYPDLASYTKLAFPYALWNPDRSILYDVQRTANEFRMMKLFSSMAPGCVAEPHACLDVDEMKLLVTKWSPADEQWANQMIDGDVDMRLSKTVPLAISKLHRTEVDDPNFNSNIRPSTASMFPVLRKYLHDSIDSSYGKSKYVALAKEFGEDLCDTMMDNMTKDYNSREYLVHGDFTVFNILVEKKPNGSGDSGRFGDRGTFVVCDWEMSFVGPIGRDLGLFLGFPVACVICHALNGHEAAVDNLMTFVDAVWENYCSAMLSHGKSQEFMRSAFRNVIAWCGWTLLVYLSLGIHMNFLPFDQENKEERAKVMELTGVLMLKFLRWGFADHEPNLSLDELHQRFKDAVDDEVRYALSKTRSKPRPRRSSELRASGKRVSGTEIFLQDARRLSLEEVS